MEPKFVVETTINTDCQLEASRGVMPKATRVLNYVCIGITVILLGVILWQYIATREKGHLILLLVLIAVFGLLALNQIRGPRTALKRWEQSIRQRYGTNALHLRTEFYELTLAQTMLEDDSMTEQGYSGISELKETEHLFLLHCGRQQWFFVSKEGFQVGTPDEFRAFIQDRIGG